ncbi:MAG: hypothetical protein JXR61_06565 [Prolixibacteraceae bacterium]|nr:hypothetical protein [Prolixibacteraceae bacterium]
MNEKTLMTYSLLSHLKENRNKDLSGILEIFSPIVKKAIYEYAKSKGISEIKGKNISEIQKKIAEIFGIEIPLGVLSIILKQIEKEINDISTFKLFDDNAFIINSFVFTALDDEIKNELSNVEFLETDFIEFCKHNNQQLSFEELTSFLFTLKSELFTTEGGENLDVNYLIPKYIKIGLKDDKIRKILSDLYLGNLLTSYLEYKIKKPVTNAELLVDTNFFISLINLNTYEAYLTCKHLFEYCSSMGFRFSILYSTIDQIKILLTSRIHDFSNKDLGLVKEADVFGACIRRNIDKTHLERIKDSIDKLIREYKFDIIQEARIQSIIEEAKKSEKYKELKELRRNYQSALHDTVAYFYVQKKRGKAPREFSDVKCWFLNNSFKHDYYTNQGFKIHQRFKICASELLTLLWLANPNQKNIDYKIVSQGGLATSVAKYRNNRIPSDKVILDIKNRAEQAHKIGAITEQDVYSVSVRMTEGQLTNGEAQEIAQMPDEKFIKAVKEYSSEDEQLLEKVKSQNETITKQTELLNKLVEDNIQQKFQNKLNEFYSQRDDFVDLEYTKKSIKMNNMAWIYILFILVLLSLWFVNSNYSQTLDTRLSTIIGFLIFLSTIFLRFVEHKSILFCLKFTFLKRSRLVIKAEIIEKLKVDYERNNQKPNLEEFKKEYKPK